MVGSIETGSTYAIRPCDRMSEAIEGGRLRIVSQEIYPASR
jgi:hypothetical protein